MSFIIAASHSAHIEVRPSPFFALCLHNHTVGSRLQAIGSPQLFGSYKQLGIDASQKQYPTHDVSKLASFMKALRTDNGYNISSVFSLCLGVPSIDVQIMANLLNLYPQDLDLDFPKPRCGSIWGIESVLRPMSFMAASHSTMHILRYVHLRFLPSVCTIVPLGFGCIQVFRKRPQLFRFYNNWASCQPKATCYSLY